MGYKGARLLLLQFGNARVLCGGAGLAAEMRGVLLSEVSPLLRQIVGCKDCRNRAGRNTSAAIDALDRIDEQLIAIGESVFVLLGWMQSTGHASTQAVSLVPIQGSAIT